MGQKKICCADTAAVFISITYRNGQDSLCIYFSFQKIGCGMLGYRIIFVAGNQVCCITKISKGIRIAKIKNDRFIIFLNLVYKIECIRAYSKIVCREAGIIMNA